MSTSTNSKESKVIDPGYGYRLLRPDEILQEGDESTYTNRTTLAWFEISVSVGEQAGRAWDCIGGPVAARRKIDVGAGYRLVGENEIILPTDEHINYSYTPPLTEWSPDTGGVESVRTTPAQRRRSLVDPTQVHPAMTGLAFRRKLAAPTPVSRAISSSFSKTIAEEVAQLERENAELKASLERLQFGLSASQQELESERANLRGHKQVLKATREALVTPEGESLVARAKAVVDQRNAAQLRLSGERDASARFQMQRDDAWKDIERLKTELASLKANASGNAVLVGKDGFQRPTNVAPWQSSVYTYSYDGFERAVNFGLPTLTSSVKTRQFLPTAQKDAFGRTIFEEV